MSYVYRHSVGSALLIFGRWAYQSLTCGISDEHGTRALFYMLPWFIFFYSALVPATVLNNINNKKKQKQSSREYLAPMVEVLSAHVERGFQASGEMLPTGRNEDLVSSGEVHGGSDFD